MDKGGDAPPAPDYKGLIGEQTAANKDTANFLADLNRVDTYTPYGSLTYNRGDDGAWTAAQTLSPQQQGLVDTQSAFGMNAGQKAIDSLNNLPGQMDTSNLPGYTVPTTDNLSGFQAPNTGSLPGLYGLDMAGLSQIPGLGDFGAESQRSEDAAFNSVWDRLSPQFEEEQRALETKLANQGIQRTTDAFGDQMDKFSDRKNDARTRAAYDAVQAGENMRRGLFSDALQSRGQGFGEQMGLANVGSQQRQQLFGEQQGLADYYARQRAQQYGENQGLFNNQLAARGQEFGEQQYTQQAPYTQTAQLASMLQNPQLPTPAGVPQIGGSTPNVNDAYSLYQNAMNQQYQADQQASNNMWGTLGTLGGGLLGGIF